MLSLSQNQVYSQQCVFDRIFSYQNVQFTIQQQIQRSLMNPTFATFKQLRQDTSLRNISKQINNVGPRTFQEVKACKQNVIRANDEQNRVFKFQCKNRQGEVGRNFRQIRKSASQIGINENQFQNENNVYYPHAVAQNNKKVQYYHTSKKQSGKLCRPNILAPSIIKNKTFLESYRDIKYKKKPNESNYVNQTLIFEDSQQEKKSNYSQNSDQFGKYSQKYSEEYSLSVQSSFGNDSSKDSCFNISNISESINNSYTSVTERASAKKYDSNTSENYIQKQLYFPECSFGNSKKEDSLNKSILSEKLETNSSYCEQPPTLSLKKQSSINFTKKFKYYRENTPNSSNVKNNAVKVTPIQSARQSLTHEFQKSQKKQIPEKLGLNQFNLLKQIGEGKYGKVYLAHHKKTNFICALKTISKKIIIQENLFDTFIQQIKIQSYLHHPNIVKLYGYFTDNDNFYLIMEYCGDGHLLHLTKQKKNFHENQVLDILENVFEAVAFIHGHGVIHRDLKPENIVIQHGMYKICDFGWAAYAGRDRRTTFCGTPLYVSPQVLIGDCYDAKTDIWGLGVLTYQLVYGMVPFPILKQSDMVRIVKDPVHYPSWPSISPQLLSLIKCMLQKDPQIRPSLNLILASPLLSKHQKQQIQIQTCIL